MTQDYEFDLDIDRKMQHADSFLPWAIRGPFANAGYARMHGSFINFLGDGIYDMALHELTVVASQFERDRHPLSPKFWQLMDDLAIALDVVEDYRDWRAG